MISLATWLFKKLGYYAQQRQFGKESSQANDAWLQWACWDSSERLIKEKLGPNVLLPWK
ncbi:hypothetical protein QFC19_006347 [Naganishia cerealis]|uniref:Uncharacterized protein n=1 Tax=Naganishia cerealis TaxID=610337 RepID=A0ACC2VHA4_9TREE|nr:hypothetical protein QFC19_006347 [Naganishia cerealis]